MGGPSSVACDRDPGRRRPRAERRGPRARGGRRRLRRRRRHRGRPPATTNPRIYAAGDIASRFKFTHTADALARIVLTNALFLGRKKASALTVPWCTYTSPEIAHVGLYEHDATATAASRPPRSPSRSTTSTALGSTARTRASSRPPGEGQRRDPRRDAGRGARRRHDLRDLASPWPPAWGSARSRT